MIYSDGKIIGQKDMELELHAYDWNHRDCFDREETYLSIHCWGMNENSDPILLRIDNFPAYCYIELPCFVRGRAFKWNKSEASHFMDQVLSKLSGDISSWSLVSGRKTYYYRNGRTTPMIKVDFRSMSAVWECFRLVGERPVKTERWGFISCNVMEHKISPVRKLLTAVDVQYSQWFTCVGRAVEEEDRISTCEREYTVDWNSIRKSERTSVTRPRILAFDIETYSDNHRAFPDKMDSKHVCYMISCIYQRYLDPSSKKRYGIVLGDCDDIPRSVLDDCEIVKVKDELEMVDAFAEIVDRLDPEIITGYNIYAYDYPYLDHRVKRWLREWPNMGRIKGGPSIMVSDTWSSAAYGHQSINILKMDGRISIDLLPIIKRDFKRDKYDLGSVSKDFLGKTKHDISAPEMFAIYERSLQNTEEGRRDLTRVLAYCIQDSELVIDLMEKLNVWVSLVQVSSVVGVSITDLNTRGQQHRCLSLLYDQCARAGFVLDAREAPGYAFEGALVQQPVPGVYDNVICLDFSSLYPSIIQAYNMCYTTLVGPELDDVVPDEDCNIIEFDQTEEDESDSDDEDDEEKEKVKKSPRVHHYRFRFYKKTKGIVPGLVAALVAERRATVARMRKTVSRIEELERDPNTPPEELKELEMLAVTLDKRQGGLKVTANSFFGFFGVKEGGKMPLMEAAISITAKGRQLISEAREFVERTYDGMMVYGDTDSVMFKIPIVKESKDCDYWGKKIAQDINGVREGEKDVDGKVWPEGRKGLFPPPLAIEFEKAMRLFCIKKKKYAANLIEPDGSFKMDKIMDKTGKEIGRKKSIMKKGIVLARRDNCPFLRLMYTEILEIVMDGGTLQHSLRILRGHVERMMRDEVDPAEYKIVRALGSNYASDSYFMKVFAENLRAEGKTVNPGDRLDYVIVETDKVLLGDKMVLFDSFDSEKHKIDKSYYLEKVLTNPIDQLIGVGFRSTIETLPNIYYQKSSSKRTKPITLSSPLTMMRLMMERSMDLSKLTEAVEKQLENKKKPPTIRIIKK